jgi:PPOX class probable F420-dependent enzyme
MAQFPAGFEDLWSRPLIGHLATVRPDGAPAVTPMWFLWDGDWLCFTHTTSRAKLRNIEHQPWIALSVNDPDKPHRYIQARCLVEHVDPDPGGMFYGTLQRRYSWPPTSSAPDSAGRVVIRARPMVYSTQDL